MARIPKGVGFVLPAVLLMIIFFLIPLVSVLVSSFQKYEILGANSWTGLKNYRMVLVSKEFWRALWNTLVYTIIVTPLIILPAILLAVTLKHGTIGVKFLRAIYFIPYTISFVAASYIWSWIYNDTYGVLNYLLHIAGILDRQVNWLGNTWSARIMISLMISWKTMGFPILILLAGLSSINKEVYEASAIDGAGRSRVFFSITLPLLRPTIFLVLVMSVAGSFKAFDHFFIMTSGGPMRTTETIVMYINKVAFENYEMGQGSAISVLFLFLLLFVSYQQIRLGEYDRE
ncbi:sugar ABC transporter permease [Marispirochaeta aestuarii]|uniref:carbohydrate ABC transporter permease n=1 Tax=Marispirochaeta aestuarii TaxID=1963862 RepID=UPI0029C8C881|nr:sugar ABC transporter permease [Marispirochaeta aestuarii]